MNVHWLLDTKEFTVASC